MKSWKENDIQESIQDQETIFQTFNLLPESVRWVLVDMRFSQGPNRFRYFRIMFSAVKDQNFTQAAAEMKDYRWYTQVGQRVQTLVSTMTEVRSWRLKCCFCPLKVGFKR